MSKLNKKPFGNWEPSEKRAGTHKLWEMPCSTCGVTIYARPTDVKKGTRKTTLCLSCRSSSGMKKMRGEEKCLAGKYKTCAKALSWYAMGNCDTGIKAREYFSTT